MSARIWQQDTLLIDNKYGIPEPTDQTARMDEKRIEVVFVPLLAFDLQGNRLGYGGGFYDRLWEASNSETLWVGLSLMEAAGQNLPSEAHDLKLNYALTPTQAHRF